MSARRTEHCWPVAHTLSDLLPLIPDPASFEAGSSLHIERIMLPDVHQQLVQEIARRFCPDAGWFPVYLTNYATRAVQIDLGTSEGCVIHTHCNQRAIDRLLAEIEEESLKPLVMTEVANVVADLSHHFFIPRPVTSIESKACPYCKRDVFMRWDKHKDVLKWHCRCSAGKATGSCFHLSASVPGKPKPEERSRIKVNKHWTREESYRAAKMRADGMEYAAIGQVLGRGQHSIRIHLRTGGYEGMLKRKALHESIPELDF